MIVLVMIPRGGGVCGNREGSTRDREMINAMSEGQIATQARCDITGITHCAFLSFFIFILRRGFFLWHRGSGCYMYNFEGACPREISVLRYALP